MKMIIYCWNALQFHLFIGRRKERNESFIDITYEAKKYYYEKLPGRKSFQG